MSCTIFVLIDMGFMKRSVSLIWDFLSINKDVIQAIGSILAPISIFLGSVLVQVWIYKESKKRDEREREIDRQREDEKKEFSEAIAKYDRESSIEQLRKETLDSYLDRMISLIERNITSRKEPEPALFQAARAITIATLKELDSNRNRQVTTLLYETNLLQKVTDEANRNGSILYQSDLKEAQLKNSFFKNANLESADFEGADLRGANLEGANLTNANLRDANL